MTKIIQILQAAPLLEVWTINTDFLWKLVMIFGGLASLCFLLIFYLRYRFSSRSGSRTARKTALEPVIRNYLLEYTESATDNDEDILWMKMEIRQLLKDPIDRRVITDIILEVQREALPETRLRISELYRHFELHDNWFV